MPKRCALGCPFISGKPYHQFPHPVKNPDRFKAWVCIVGGGKLDSQDEIQLYRKKVLCGIHFTDKDKNRNNRLNFLAVPSLHLDGKADEIDSAEKEVRFNVLTEVQRGLAPLTVEVKEENQSTSKQDLDNSAFLFKSEGMPKKCIESDAMTVSGREDGKIKPEESIDLSDHEISTQVFMSEPILDLPSESNQYLTVSGALDITSAKTSPILKSKNKYFRNEPLASRQTETVMCPDLINNANNLKEHSYCARDKTDIKKPGESKYHQPTPPLIVNQLQIARKKVKQLQSEVIRLRKRNKIVATRLINAKKNSKHNCLQKITQNMTAAAKMFTHMQYTQTQKKNGGRRFTLEGQQLSLSIYKSSPQCYHLLSKLFTLPSVKTLKRLRTQFDIQPGLNNDLDEGPIQPDTF